jgi:hypothetical protein
MIFLFSVIKRLYYFKLLLIRRKINNNKLTDDVLSIEKFLQQNLFLILAS